MRFFKEDTTVQQHEAKQSRRFTPIQYIAAFVVMVLGLPVANSATITSFSPNQSISSTSVDKFKPLKKYRLINIFTRTGRIICCSDCFNLGENFKYASLSLPSSESSLNFQIARGR